jgi:hypothetical protein
MESLSARQLNYFLSLQCRYRNTFCFYHYVGFACLHGLHILMSHLEDVGVDRRIILKRICKVQSRRLWTQFIWLRTGTNGKPL